MRAYLKNSRERCWKIYQEYYGNNGYETHNEIYQRTVSQYLRPDICLLDAGCGAELPFTHKFAPHVRLAVGTDLEELMSTAQNPCSVRADLGSLPFSDKKFDVIVSMSVLEHLADPKLVFRELSRILKPNGIVILQTPNKYDYVSLIARYTPFWFHRWALSLLMGRKEEDTFPTFFRANTLSEMGSLLRDSGFTALSISLINQYPAYLMFSPILFRLGISYERLTSRFDSLAQLRGWILAVAQKK
jgi:SAM-dependent methyltransferase